MQKKDKVELKEIVIDKEKDNILVRKKKYRQRTEQLTEFLKTKDINTVDEQEKQEIIARIRETLPKRRGIGILTLVIIQWMRSALTLRTLTL